MKASLKKYNSSIIDKEKIENCKIEGVYAFDYFVPDKRAT